MASGPVAVVVWCHHSRNLWVPFEPSVSNFIENRHSSLTNNGNRQRNNHIIDIGQLSLEFSACEIDLQRRVLRMPAGGTEQQIDRHICPPGSHYSNNAVWEFEGNPHDKPWIAFDIVTSQLIEDAVIHRGTGVSKKKGCSILDLKAKRGLPYIINVKSKYQKNINTSKERKIRRTNLKQGYVCDATHEAAEYEPMRRHGTVSLPKKTRINLKELKGSNFKNVDEFLKKYTIPVAKNDDKVEDFDFQLDESSVDDGAEGDDVKKDDDKICDKQHGAGNGDDNEKENENEEECAICFDNLSSPSGYGDNQGDADDVVRLGYCLHTFHKLCVVQMYKSCGKDGYLECPTCKRIHGEKTGNCPAGWMGWTQRKDLTLPGHKGCGTLEITYNISKGIQAIGHPNPGTPFNASGFPRMCYLPDTYKGRIVLKLLMEAFHRRLMFTIGTSATTGRSDTVIWNDIHHKTEANSNKSGHGYPDPNYLDNVMMELNVQGVTPDILNDE